MKYVVFTSCYEGLPVALKLKEEGNWVLVAMDQKKEDDESDEQYQRRMSLYDGMVSKMEAQEAVDLLLKVEDKENYFVWFDFNYHYRFAEQLAGKGFKGNFPTEGDRKFEEDREFAKDFVKKNYPGVQVAEVHEFKTKEEAEEFMESSPEEIWVLKGKDDSAKTVLPQSDDPEIARQEIMNAFDDPSYEQAGFILELKITNPIEVTPQKVYWNGKPLFTNIDIENKEIGAGEHGCMTGCAQDLIIQTDMNSWINDMAFPPAVDKLAKEHEGLFLWDISFLIDSRTGKYYMGEFCPNRNGYNAFYGELSMLPRVSDYFESISEGKNPFRKSTGTFAASVRMFSLTREDDFTPKKDEPVIVSPDSDRFAWLMNVKSKGGRVVQAGYWWQKEYADVCVATSYGNTMEEAVTRCYEVVKGITFDSALYRPIFDYLSDDYATSIPNRLEYMLSDNAITIPNIELVDGIAPEVTPFHFKRKVDEKEYEAFYKKKYEDGVASNERSYNNKVRELSKQIQSALSNG